VTVVKLAFAVVAGIGGVVALVVAYRRQRTLEQDEAGRRDHFQPFNWVCWPDRVPREGLVSVTGAVVVPELRALSALPVAWRIAV
jgi:hypothetical protein